MVSMALYGGALIGASGGAMVATERALGWSRQLRLTPLNSVAYIVVKAIVAFVMAGFAVAIVNVVGVFKGLHLLFADSMADRWPRLANRGPVFERLTPIAAMIEGGIPRMLETRHYVDALRGGL